MAKKPKVEAVEPGSELKKRIAAAGMTGIIRLAEEMPDLRVRSLSTGFYRLDRLINMLMPGVARGCDVEVFSKKPSDGKAQPLTSLLKTVDGWISMRDIRVGDALASIDGAKSVVEGVYPQGMRKVFRVTFSDGRSMRCCGEHLWSVRKNHTAKRRAEIEYELYNTYDLIELLKSPTNTNRGGMFSIPTVSGHFGSETTMPLDPWLLGMLLGDGNIADYRTPKICCADPENVIRLQQVIANYGCELHRVTETDHDYRISKQGEKNSRVPNRITEILKELNVSGHRSDEKFIPPMYLNADRSVRGQLLMGLLDSDGDVTKVGSVNLTTTSLQLARDTQELIRSLGGISQICGPYKKYHRYKGEKREGKPAYRVPAIMRNIGDFVGLSRKRSRVASHKTKTPRLSVTKIEQDGFEEVQCIKVSHPSHLYITDNYIVTHNTTLVLQILSHWQKLGMRIAILDLERTITDTYLKMLQITMQDMIVDQSREIFAPIFVRPDKEVISVEKVLDAIKFLSDPNGGNVDAIVVDSVGVMNTQKNLDKQVGDPAQFGGIAGVLTDFMKKNIAKQPTIFWLNQAKQGMTSMPGIPASYKTVGGGAIKFWSSLRLELARVKTFKPEESSFGFETKVLVPKNKMGRDNVSITMTYVPGEGFSHVLDYLSAAQDLGIVTKGGAWFQFGDRKFQGMGQLYYGMREDSGLFTALMDEVNAAETPFTIDSEPEEGDPTESSDAAA